MEDKIYIRCENCAHWREIVRKYNSSYRSGFCTFWKNINELVYADDYCSKGIGRRK